MIRFGSELSMLWTKHWVKIILQKKRSNESLREIASYSIKFARDRMMFIPWESQDVELSNEPKSIRFRLELTEIQTIL